MYSIFRAKRVLYNRTSTRCYYDDGALGSSELMALDKFLWIMMGRVATTPGGGRGAQRLRQGRDREAAG